MTKEEFIYEILAYYRESRKIIVDPGEYNIWRGVRHSISSKAEDLFSLFVAKELKDKSLEFIVDKTWTLNIDGHKIINFRPDLAIVQSGILTHIIDLKMDMGYKRRYFEDDSFKNLAKRFALFRNMNGGLKVSYMHTEPMEVKVSKKIINQIVVLTTANGGKASNRNEMIEAIDKLEWTNIYYLTEGIHLNNYQNISPSINDKEFNRLFNDIRKNLQ